MINVKYQFLISLRLYVGGFYLSKNNFYFLGHINKINCITHLNTENCFITTSRDKTVQLWSLTDTYNSDLHSVSINHKITNNNVNNSNKSLPIDSSNHIVARLVYRAHRKSVIAAHYLEPYRLVASIDSCLIFWDPWMGKTVCFIIILLQNKNI